MGRICVFKVIASFNLVDEINISIDVPAMELTLSPCPTGRDYIL